MTKILIHLTLSLILISFSPSVLPNLWFIDILSHFKVQISAILLVILLINLFTLNIRWINLLVILGIIWNSAFYIPLFFQKQNNTNNKDKNISITCINLYSANTNINKVEQFILSGNSDILVLLEMTPEWEKELQKIIVTYPYKKVITRTDNFGIAVLSKINGQFNDRVFYFSSVPSIIGTFFIENSPVTIIAAHPRPPVNKKQFLERNAQLAGLGSNIYEFSNNLILIGDLNMTSYSKHFSDLKKSLNLTDTRSGFGILPTWPTQLKPLYITLDHCLISGDLKVYNRKTGINIGSDHLPIIVELGLN